MVYICFIKVNDMKRILKNNEGRLITVSSETFNEVRAAYDAGTWSVVVEDINGHPHVVIVPDNF